MKPLETMPPQTRNVTNLLLVADAIEEDGELKFDMQSYCGTACCIAGHTVALFDRTSFDKATNYYPSFEAISEIPIKAANLLGLRNDEAVNLFICYDDWYPTKSEAATFLREIAAGAAVEWPDFYRRHPRD